MSGFNNFSLPEKNAASLLITGIEVIAVITSAERKTTREPTNIQNSREDVSSSLATKGICLYRFIKRNNAGRAKRNRNNLKCHTVIPSPVKACTEVSCRSPLLVRYVE